MYYNNKFAQGLVGQGDPKKKTTGAFGGPILRRDDGIGWRRLFAKNMNYVRCTRSERAMNNQRADHTPLVIRGLGNAG